jgi:hypothetical protein
MTEEIYSREILRDAVHIVHGHGDRGRPHLGGPGLQAFITVQGVGKNRTRNGLPHHPRLAPCKY